MVFEKEGGHQRQQKLPLWFAKPLAASNRPVKIRVKLFIGAT
jgi:hypothetical protein